jgi:uncharacterized protein YkwD
MTLFAVAAAAVALIGTPQTAAAESMSGILAPRSACRGQASTSALPAVQRRALRCLINRARRHAGLAALRPVAELDRSAAMRAAEIRRCNDVSHMPCGEPFVTVFTAVHYLTGAGSVGENLGWGQGRLGTARTVMASWLASAVHRQILLAPAWRDVGIGRLRAARLQGLANVTIWVAQFGRRAA